MLHKGLTHHSPIGFKMKIRAVKAYFKTITPLGCKSLGCFASYLPEALPFFFFFPVFKFINFWFKLSLAVSQYFTSWGNNFTCIVLLSLFHCSLVGSLCVSTQNYSGCERVYQDLFVNYFSSAVTNSLDF